MSEEEKMDTAAPGPTELPDAASERYTSLNWAVWIGAGGAASVVLFNVVLYFQTGAWQMLAVAAGSALGIACLVPARRLGRQGRFDTASYWTVGGMIIAFGAGELLHAGLTPFLAAGGVLLTLILGNLLAPRKRWVWIGAVGLFLAYTALINWWEPLPRFDMQQVGTFSGVFAAGLVVFLIVAGLFSIIRAYRRIATLRTRLTTSFAMVALLPVLTVVVALGTFGLRTARQQVIDRLEPVAVLKEAEIENWVRDLQIDLGVILAGQQVVPNMRLLGQEPEGGEAHQAAAAVLREHLRGVLEQTGRLEKVFLLDLDGQVLVSTDVTQEGRPQGGQIYFQEGLEAPYVQPPRYSVTTIRASLFVARPIQDEGGQTLGVLAGRASLANLDELMAEQTGLGETGETYLVGTNHALLTPVRFSRVNAPIYSTGVDNAVDSRQNGSGLYARRGTPVVGAYRWLPDLEVALVAEQEQAEALAPIFTTLSLVSGIVLVGVLVAIGVALLVTRGLARPLARLTETTAQVAAGDLSLVAQVERRDEIGRLARTFNTLTAQIRDLVGGLEQRVADRTKELEERSAYLEASAEVGRTASSILDPQDLVRQIVELIRDRFDLYYVGLFLVDAEQRWAVLQAGTGSAGKAMLARGHRIRVGEGMIGWSVANNQWRVALEAGEDAVRLATPELPETRSEGAFPLHSRGRVIGALTVQDDVPEAFDPEEIVAFQVMADQVAVALDNARLFAESQEALEAERRAYGEISREAWARLVHSRQVRGYRCDERGVSSITNDGGSIASEPDRQEATAPSDDGGAPVVSVPVPIRDQVVGTLNFRKAGGGEVWSSEEVEFLKEMGEQLGLALEGARLYQDTQRRAAREELLGEVTARIRESLDLETILKTTATEAREALGLPEVVVRLAPEAQAGRDGRERPADGDGSGGSHGSGA